MRYTFNPFTGQFDVVASSSSAPHDLLSETHSDTLPASPVAGDIIYADTTPNWTKRAIGSFENVLGVNAALNAPVWRQLTTNDPNVAVWGSGGDVSLELSIVSDVLRELANGASPLGIVAKDTAISVAFRTITGGTGVTITDGDGVAGDPDISLNLGAIDHNSLLNLAVGDEHTQYLLLDGRPGITNNPIISSTGDGAIAGSSFAGSDLYLFSTSNATKGALRFDDTQIWWEDIPDLTGDTLRLARFDATASMDSTSFLYGVELTPTLACTGGGTIHGLRFTPTLTVTSNTSLSAIAMGGTITNTAAPSFGGTLLMQNAIAMTSATADVGPYGNITIASIPSFTFSGTGLDASTNTLFGVGSIGFHDQPSIETTGAGTLTISHAGYSLRPNLRETSSGPLIIPSIRGLWARAYTLTGNTGSPAVDEYVAVEVDDLAHSTLALGLSLRSVGAAMEMRHVGGAVFGANAGPNNASTGLELSSTTKAILPSRMTQAQRDALTGVDGMVVYNSTTGQHSVRQGSRWNETPGWHVSIVKSADQSVTNTTTLTDDTELQFAVLANEVWHVELRLGLASNNATSDGKWGFTASANSFVTAASNWSGVYYANTGTLTNTAPTVFASVTEAVTGGTASSNGDTNLWPIHAIYRFRASADATVKVQFALLASAAAGRSCTMHSGSMLQARRVA